MVGGGMSGHWEGNISGLRYGVYPQGSYSIGDYWYSVIDHYYTVHCYEVPTLWWFGWAGVIGCSGLVTILVCATKTQCDRVYYTTYGVYKYDPMTWENMTGLSYNPLNPNHGWVLRHTETRYGQLWS